MTTTTTTNCIYTIYSKMAIFLLSSVLATTITSTTTISEDWRFSGINIARSKNTTQQPGNHENRISSLAVDGNTSVGYYGSYCTHTAAADGNIASWSVDLGEKYFITGIRIFTRFPDNQETIDRLKNFAILGYINGSRSVLYNDTGLNKYSNKVINITQNGTSDYGNITVEIPAHTSYPDNGKSYLMLCEVEIYGGLCQAPVAKENVAIFRDSTSQNDSYVLNFSCDVGFQLSVNNSVSCNNSNRTWNGSFPSCDIVNCSDPDMFEHGYYTYKNMSNWTGNLPYESIIVPKCQVGYNLNNVSSNRKCQANSFWSGAPPMCDVVTCEHPGQVPNGSYSGFGNIQNTNFNYTFTINVKCETGFNLTNGSESRTCLADGTWNGATPVCSPIVCKVPDFFKSGYYILSNNNATSLNETVYLIFNTSITAICNDSVVVRQVASKLRKCTADGTWDGDTPKCDDVYIPPIAAPINAVLIGSICGAVVALILVGLLVGLILYCRRRNQMNESKIPSEKQSIVPLKKSKIAKNSDVFYEHMNPQPNNSETVSKEYGNVVSEQCYYNLSDSRNLPGTAIKIADLFYQVFTREDASENFKKQFEGIPKGLLAAHEAALKPANKSKCRYKNMYPYDETRVVLNTDEDEQCDFINACFVNGFCKLRTYVASQGPTKEILVDFWRMVWQINSEKIVMLTNLLEDYQNKCEQYWPSEGMATYGKLSVTLQNTEIYTDYTIRTFGVKMNSKERLVTQFHFTAWPDKDVPRYVSSLTNFLNIVKYFPSNSDGPVIVHCSAGVGRTGTFIALDYLIDQAKELGYVDVVGSVTSLRQQRVNLVQTLEQYVFVHQALVELLMLSSSGLPSNEFPKVYQELMQVDPRKRKRKLDIEFEMMTTLSPTTDQCQYVSAKNIKNRTKNRYLNILPAAEFMPTVGAETENNDGYINAVFLPSYKEKNAFVITQSPLESTKEDFWNLVYEHDVRTLVMMNHISELKEGEIYWPKNEQNLTFGDLVISHSKTEVVDGHVVVAMTVSKFKLSRKIKLIQCGHWAAASKLPESAIAMLNLLQIVQKWQQDSGNKIILVHCINGADKSGLFCVISAVIERLKIEQDVAISQTIQGMRQRREQIISSVEQFQFCHHVVLEFLQQNATYGNFSLECGGRL